MHEMHEMKDIKQILEKVELTGLVYHWREHKTEWVKTRLKKTLETFKNAVSLISYNDSWEELYIKYKEVSISIDIWQLIERAEKEYEFNPSFDELRK